MKKNTFKKIVSSAALAVLLSAGAVAAQSTSTATDTTVGTPNTGAGGMSTANLMLLGGSAAVAVVGAVLLARKRSL